MINCMQDASYHKGTFEYLYTSGPCCEMLFSWSACKSYRPQNDKFKASTHSTNSHLHPKPPHGPEPDTIPTPRIHNLIVKINNLIVKINNPIVNNIW